MKKVNILVCFAFYVISISELYGQKADKNYPVIGEHCPDFTLKNIDGYPSKEMSLKELKGQFVILGFWSKNCSGCVAAFPKYSRLQQQFKDKALKIIMVAWDEPLVHSVWKTYKEKLHLQMLNAFDTIVTNQMKIESAGINVWIDKDGIVKAVTDHDDVNEKNINSFISESNFKPLSDYSIEGQKKLKDGFNYNRPMFIAGNGGADTAYDFRSIISVWQKGQPSIFLFGPKEFIRSANAAAKKGISRKLDYPFMNVGMTDLYRVACGYPPLYGEGSNDSIVGFPAKIEVKDTSRFNKLNEKRYNYAIHLPPSLLTYNNLQRTMQHTLEDYFGYKAVIEYRFIPCLNLVVSDSILAKNELKVRDSIPLYVTPSGISLYNFPTRVFCSSASLYLHSSSMPFIVDKTGITDKISIQIKDVLMSDWHDIQKALKPYGLNLVPSTTYIKTVVIKDVESE